jgi:hypothetical protein
MCLYIGNSVIKVSPLRAGRSEIRISVPLGGGGGWEGEYFHSLHKVQKTGCTSSFLSHGYWGLLSW